MDGGSGRSGSWGEHRWLKTHQNLSVGKALSDFIVLAHSKILAMRNDINICHRGPLGSKLYPLS